jgi:hypothetical protein
MAEFKGKEYTFPDEQDDFVKDSSESEIEIEDDTPEEDRGRKTHERAVEEVTDEELSSYDEKVQARIKKFTRGYHDERRAKEEAFENVRRQNLTPNRLLTKTNNFSNSYLKEAKFILSKPRKLQKRTLKKQSAHINRLLKTEIQTELLLHRNKLPVP